MSDPYAHLDLTWTIQRIDQRTPLGRHGAAMMRLLGSTHETLSRRGRLVGDCNHLRHEGTRAIVRVSSPK